jgi:transporter family protein
MQLGVMFGLLAMLSWGAADFIAAWAIRQEGTFKTLLWSHIISMVLCIGAYMALFGGTAIASTNVIMGLGAGLLGIMAYMFFYKGLEVGEASVITPISGCWVIVTILIGIVVYGQTFSMLQMTGIGLAVTGSIATSLRLSDIRASKRLTHGIHYAVLTVLVAGVFYSSLDALTGQMGWFLPIVLIKSAGTLALLAYAPVGKKTLSFPRASVVPVLLVGTLGVIAYLAFSRGIHTQCSFIVAPICAAFPVVTILLSQHYLGERMALHQKAGVVALLGGVVMLSL